MTDARRTALNHIETYFDDGLFRDDLAALVAHPSESQRGETDVVLCAYLNDAVAPRLERSDFDVQVFDNPVVGGGPILVGSRIEDAGLDTVLFYGHGDVVYGLAGQWADGMHPFALHEAADRYYGRGVADNKGQHLINIAALEAVLATRGRLGFNVKVLLEMSEEIGSTRGWLRFVRPIRRFWRRMC